MATFPRETVEFQPITVTVDGATVTTGVSFAVTAPDARPATFTPATILDGRTGVMIEGLTVGFHRVWAKVASNPETPVIDCGTIRIT